MELKNLAKNTTILAFPKIINFLLKLIRAKLNAILIGTMGVGIVSQLQVVFNKLSQMSLLAMNIGCTKLIAEKNTEEKKEEIASIIKTIFILVLPLTVIIYLSGFLFSKQITKLILGENDLNKYFLIIFMVFPFLTIASVLKSVLTGFKKIKYIAISELLLVLITFVTFVPLIYYFHISGAVVNYAISIITTFILAYIYTLQKTLKSIGVSVNDIVKSKYSKIYAKELLIIGGIGMTLGYYDIFYEITSRSILVNQLGISKIGLYSPIIAWGGLFTGLIFPSISQYIFPRLSETKSDEEIALIINDILRFVTFVVLPFILLGISYRDIALRIFYSSEFLEAAKYLPFHFFGILWVAWWYALMQIFTPTGRVKKYVPFGVSFTTINFIIIYLFVPVYGLWAWVATFSIIPVIAVITLFIYFKKEIGLSINNENKKIIIYGVLSSLLIILIPVPQKYLYFIGPLLVGGMCFFIKENEKEYIYAIVVKYLNKIPIIKKK